MALTVKQLAKLTEPGRYGDGRGLYLQVTRAGVRSWLLRYERDDPRAGRAGKRRERWMGLGPVSDFTLDEARERARKQRQLLKDGIDPLDARRAERAKQAAEAALAAAKDKTFTECAQLYFDRHSAGWKNKKHIAQFLSTLSAYVFPKIGALPVADVNRDLVLSCVQPIWNAKNATASRVLRRIRGCSISPRSTAGATAITPPLGKAILNTRCPSRAALLQSNITKPCRSRRYMISLCSYGRAMALLQRRFNF